MYENLVHPRIEPVLPVGHYGSHLLVTASPQMVQADWFLANCYPQYDTL